MSHFGAIFHVCTVFLIVFFFLPTDILVCPFQVFILLLFVSLRDKYIFWLFIVQLRATCTFYDGIDLSLGLHSALCSSTLDPFSPTAKSLVSRLGFTKTSLLLTSYFSKKNYGGGKGGLGGAALHASTSVWAQFSAPAFTADQNVKLLFLQQSLSRATGASRVGSELGEGLKCLLPCSEQPHIVSSVCL